MIWAEHDECRWLLWWSDSVAKHSKSASRSIWQTSWSWTGGTWSKSEENIAHYGPGSGCRLVSCLQNLHRNVGTLKEFHQSSEQSVSESSLQESSVVSQFHKKEHDMEPVFHGDSDSPHVNLFFFVAKTDPTRVINHWGVPSLENAWLLRSWFGDSWLQHGGTYTGISVFAIVQHEHMKLVPVKSRQWWIKSTNTCNYLALSHAHHDMKSDRLTVSDMFPSFYLTHCWYVLWQYALTFSLTFEIITSFSDNVFWHVLTKKDARAESHILPRGATYKTSEGCARI